MSVDAPVTYRSSLRDAPRRADAPWRLPAHHAADLGDVARGVEETNAGVCTRYLVDQLACSGRADIDEDGYINHLESVERFCDRFEVWRHPVVATWRMRIKRCRRALARMRSIGAHEDVAVLYVSYGQPDPILLDVLPLLPELLGERWPVCPLASLARYTAPVEDRRMDLVRTEVALSSPTRERFAWLDGIVTSSDALRDAVAPYTEDMPMQHRSEPDHVYQGRVTARTLRRQAHDARREAFALDVKLATSRVLNHAERQYHAAWMEVP